MPSLSDIKTQSLLEAILEELREIKEHLAETSETTNTVNIRPYIPASPSNPPKEWPARQCSRCGLSLSDVISYSCHDPNCPTGLNPTTC